jgi:hypothetical protein
MGGLDCGACETTFLQPMVEITLCRTVARCNEMLRGAVGQQPLDFRLIPIQPTLAWPAWSAQLDTCRFFHP